MQVCFHLEEETEICLPFKLGLKLLTLASKQFKTITFGLKSSFER